MNLSEIRMRSAVTQCLSDMTILLDDIENIVNCAEDSDDAIIEELQSKKAQSQRIVDELKGAVSNYQNYLSGTK